MSLHHAAIAATKPMPLNRLTVIALVALAALLMALLMSLSAPRANAQTSITNRDQVVLNPGVVIPVTLNTELSSNQSRQGDTFTATVDASQQAYNNIMRGGIVDGLVRQATPRAGDKPGTLDLAFTRLRLADGRSYALSGTLTSLDTKALQTRSDGLLQAKNTNKDQHLTYAGYGAGAGLLVGLLGGKLKINDILIGGGLGYAAGSLLKGPQQVHDVDLKPGMAMGVLLGNPVRYYHRSPPGAVDQSRQTHQTYVKSGIKHYWHNGQEWTMDLSTGKRARVSINDPSYHLGDGKYYTYQGHPYYRDPETGNRTRLDEGQ